MRILLLAGLLCPFLNFAQDNNFLVINPGTHKSQIFASDLDADGNLVTGGFDKTIKVWDTKEGHQLREYLGQIGPGSEGMIYALDVSPDNKYLACGGWLGSDDESEDLGDIRIFDYQTGKLIKLIKYHANALFCLEFTSDSRHLIAADGDGQIVKWDFLNGERVLSYNNPYDDINGLAVHDDFFMTGHWDGMILKWDLNSAAPAKKVKLFEKAKEIQINSDVEISPAGDWVAASGKQIAMILLLDPKMKLQYHFFLDSGVPVDMEFSPSGNRLAIAVKEGLNHRVEVYENAGKEWTLISTYSRHDDLIAGVKFKSEDELISFGGLNNEIAFWQIVQGDKKAKETFFNDGVGRSNFSAGLTETELAFSKTPNKAYGDADYTEIFDIFQRKHMSFDESDLKFNYPQREKDTYGIYETEPLRQTEWDPTGVLYITKDKKIVDSIWKYEYDGYRFGTFTFVEDEFIVSGCGQGVLEAWDYEGALKSTFVGHEGAIRSVTVSENGKYLISSGLDMTIRFWPINEIGLGREPTDLGSVWDYCVEMEVHDVYHQILNNLALGIVAKEKTVKAWKKVIETLEKNDFPCGFMKIRLGQRTANRIYPKVSIFIAENDEWVIWNKEGYFTSSKRGARYVGYHVNGGKEKEAKFYPFDQFDLKYNRPDIIMKDLEMADAGIIDLYRKAYLKRLKRMGITEDDLKADIHAPSVKINGYDVKNNKAYIDISADDSKYTLNRINVYVNDVPVYGRRGINVAAEKAKKMDQRLEVSLMAGFNKVQVSVLNSNGVESFKETVRINNGAASSNLFVATVGVSNYQNKDFNLQYAAKDAKDVAGLFENSNAYSQVKTKVLTDEMVTKENILGLKNFFAQATANDVVVLFIAGHGVLDKELDYYYCTQDVSFVDPQIRGISYAELEMIFDGIKPIRKLLIMDTCHSGEVDKDDVEEVAMVDDSEDDVSFRSTDATKAYRVRQGLEKTGEAVREMFNDLNRGTGATVISSAGGVEFAMESDEWKNGLFTYCLLNGLKSKEADLDKDGEILISELQTYIGQKVAKLSKGKQQPSSRFENISLDYSIWK